MATRPYIGITLGIEEGRYVLRRDYSEAVAAAGGCPVFLPFETQDLQGVQGLLISGGGDIAPDLYGEEPLGELRGVDRERDEFELSLIKEALRRGIPIFAICRGIQVLAVAALGRLIQDLHQLGGINHWQTAPRHQPHHRVEIIPSTHLHKALGVDTLLVNSFHHQAVASPPPGFQTVARTSDGVIEAIEMEGDHFALGVQWHPECMWRNDPLQFRIFQAFIEACR